MNWSLKTNLQQQREVVGNGDAQIDRVSKMQGGSVAHMLLYLQLCGIAYA
jgi:hypothetical protein